MRFIWLFVAFFSWTTLWSQTDVDALRFSYLNASASARVMSVGGGFGALGGDIGVLTINPATVSIYRSSTIEFSPRMQIDGSKTNYEGNEEKTSVRDFNLNNLGIVFSNVRQGDNWDVTAFSIGYNKMADFNRSSYFEGLTPGSISTLFLERANGFIPNNLDPYVEGLAYQTGLIFQNDPQGSPNAYRGYLYEDEVLKSQSIVQYGGINELYFAYGGNFRNMLHLGFSVGVPLLSFGEEKRYVEEDPDDLIVSFRELEYGEFLQTNGIGINLKLGAIYKYKMFRVGLAYHTRSSFALTDSYNTTMYTDISANGTTLNAESEISVFDYNLVTPRKWVGSLAYIIKKRGLISAEVEWLNYGKANFDFNADETPSNLAFENSVNDLISEKYQSAVNLRVGAEYLIKKFRIRGGFAMLGTPFASGISETSTSTQFYSTGIGYRWDNFYIDLGYRFTAKSEEYVPFTSSILAPFVEDRLTGHDILMTIGLRF